MTIKIGSTYVTTRRDIEHGSLTFHVKIDGVLSNGTVLATQFLAVGPDGFRQTSALRLDIVSHHFRDLYTLAADTHQENAQ